MQFLISAFYAILAFSVREILRHRSIAQSVIEESKGSMEENNNSLSDIVQKRFFTAVEEDRSYIPYFLLQTPPDELYRTAIDDCYLFGGNALRKLVSAYKLEQSVHQLAKDFHSDVYAEMSTARRLGYSRRFISDLKKLNSELNGLSKSLNFWNGPGILVVLLLLLDLGILVGLVAFKASY